MIMFCPKCGKSDQQVNSYCRQCGSFLPDFENLKKKETPPEEHLKANSFLNLLTAIVSLTLAIILYSMFLGKADTPIIIYVVAGFLTAMTAWQVQTFWRTILLKKHFKRNQPNLEAVPETKQNQPTLKPEVTAKLLNEPDFTDSIPASVVENTTRSLTKHPRS